MYGCCGLVEDVVDRAVLDGLPAVHHEDVVGDLGDHAEVVGDHDDRRAELLLQVAHQVEDLRLHRHVERGGRLVGDQQLGVAATAPSRSWRAAACRRRTGAGSRRRACRGVRDADAVEHLDGTVRGRPSSRRRCGRGTPRRSASRPCSTGAAPTAGPGRSSPSGCRAAGGPPPSWRRSARRRRATPRRRGARGCPCAGRGSEAGHALAGAGLAHDAERLAALEGEATARRPPSPGRRRSFRLLEQ